jgi:metalloendopeptidase OMA1, mitochondrial
MGGAATAARRVNRADAHRRLFGCSVPRRALRGDPIPRARRADADVESTPVKRWLALLLATVLVFLAACETVPISGRTQLIAFPEGEEIQMGVTAYQDVLKKSRVSADPAVNAQVARVGHRIAAATGRSDYQWEFHAIEDRQANAFCLPGGKIAVYTGILPITRDDAGLAAVLGHEVSHAIARHSGERMTQQLAVQFGLGLTQVALSGNDPRVAELGSAALGALATGAILLPFSRAQESEADHLGLVYMAKAGYHPAAARDLWVRMAEQSRGQRPPEFLSTHPAAETRIRQIEGWIPEALRYYSPR